MMNVGPFLCVCVQCGSRNMAIVVEIVVAIVVAVVVAIVVATIVVIMVATIVTAVTTFETVVAVAGVARATVAKVKVPWRLLRFGDSRLRTYFSRRGHQMW